MQAETIWTSATSIRPYQIHYKECYDGQADERVEGHPEAATELEQLSHSRNQALRSQLPAQEPLREILSPPPITDWLQEFSPNPNSEDCDQTACCVQLTCLQAL